MKVIYGGIYPKIFEPKDMPRLNEIAAENTFKMACIGKLDRGLRARWIVDYYRKSGEIWW